MSETKLLLVIAIIAVVASVVTAGFVYFSVASLTARISGFATGETNLTVESAAQINFTDASVNFGSGRVNSGAPAAHLNTAAGTVTGGNFTADSTGLRLENIGNVNVSLNLSGTKTAAQFFGGTSPVYRWNVTNVESGSCLNATGGTSGLSLTSFDDVPTTTTLYCPIFRFADSSDNIRIDFNLTVPSDSFTGALGDVITATAVAL